MTFTTITLFYLILYVLRQTIEVTLEIINARYIQAAKDRLPDHLVGKIDMPTYNKSIDYHLSGYRFGIVTRIVHALIHWFFILIGFQLLDSRLRAFGMNPYWTGLAFFGLYFIIGLILNLPFSLYHDFVLEERFGFNKKTLSVFIADILKNIAISIILGGLVIFALLWLMESAGTLWWVYCAGLVIVFQILMIWIAPTVIFPLFNKLSPLEGEKGHAAKELAATANFPVKEVLVMDASRRSGHADAFFMGFGKIKKIVLFDTLLDKTTTDQALAVLAHEIGHYKLKHIRKNLLLAGIGIFTFFGFLALMRGWPVFYHSLGFSMMSDYAVLIIFSIIFTELLFPFQMLFTRLSRRFEYAADAFAVQLTQKPEALVEALEILHTVNLSAPVVHPAYSAYHYSHPDLPERIKAIRQLE